MISRIFRTPCSSHSGNLRVGSATRLSIMYSLPFYSVKIFRDCGAQILRHADGLKTDGFLRRYKALFGVSPFLVFKLWLRIKFCPIPNAKPHHLLWALLFLRVYATEEVNVALAACDKKTYRKWCWIFVDLISKLPMVSSDGKSKIFFFFFLFR